MYVAGRPGSRACATSLLKGNRTCSDKVSVDEELRFIIHLVV